ncbi:MAG: hypothetical protein M1821_008662 [Bathelium mastoideum]|nr:MAG: hypothetical protein M1821_008662 [Bathelium mastoideum]
MRPLLNYFLFGLSQGVLALSTSSVPARVFVDEANSASTPTLEQPTLSADTARLLFAQRLGLSSFHALQDVDEEALKYINHYAAPPQRLFGDQRSTKRPQAMIIVEEVEQLEDDDSSLTSPTSFRIANPPSISSNAALLQDFVDQARSTNFGLTPSSNVVRYLEHDDASENLPDGNRYFFHRKSTHNIANLLSILRSRSATVTLIYMPASNSSNTNSWGTYSLPLETYIHSPHAHAHAKRQGDELFKAEAGDSESGENIETASAAASSSSTSSSLSSAPTSTAPPKGILPACFPNIKDCNSSTNACSGHGSCQLKFTNKDRDGSLGECYACICKNTVTKNDMGQITTTVWGGPACQKRDISTSFWLLAGFTTVMVSVIAWGIGLLVSMGSEDLPSVIGAGVSGPGARGK